MTNQNKSFYTFTTTRPVTIFMMVLAVFTFGYISLGKLPVNLLPEIAYPTITVRTEYPGAGPEDVEERVSKRIQEALSVLPGLKEISSISKPELSDVTLEFTWGTHVAFATQNIREKLDRTLLPEEVKTPIILRYDPTLDPVIRIGVTGGQDLFSLRRIAEDEIQRKLETIQGVAAVKVRGGLEEEIHVKVDKKKLRSLNLNIETLNNRLAAENVNMAAGTIREGDTEYLVRTLNQFMDLEEIMQLIIARTQDGTVRLGHIAEVVRTHKEQDIVSRINGLESVEIQIFKEAGANVVTLAKRVKDTLLGNAEQQAYRQALSSGKIPDPEELLKEA
ncbi:MAG: efflux RND transporter permease subunit, partial [Planctomycetes bacterium]|nr:efflux RND transporter permease subunit [Planctomycetota bacterium]